MYFFRQATSIVNAVVLDVDDKYATGVTKIKKIRGRENI